MKPWPAGMRESNCPRMPTDSVAPPRPASTPLPSTRQARSERARTPSVAAARGCSPAARTRSPAAVCESQRWKSTGMTSAAYASAVCPNRSRGKEGAAGLTPLEPNTDCKRYVTSPSATRLSAIPLTTWSARNRSDSKACTEAAPAPAIAPQSSPTHGEPVQIAPAAAAKAPKRIIPSSPMLTTPARSQSTPPSAARTNGGAKSKMAFTTAPARTGPRPEARGPRPEVRRSRPALRGSRPASRLHRRNPRRRRRPLGAPQPLPKRPEEAARGDQPHGDALDQLGKGGMDSDQLQPRRARAHRAEEEAGHRRAPSGAAADQRDPDAVEAIAGAEDARVFVLGAEDQERAGEPG